MTTATIERDAFLRAIADAPDDDAPRLVFADWLDEHGDPTWAAFIRSQVELAMLDEADPRYPATLARSRRTGMLTRSPSRPFADHVPGGQVMFRRGLIDSVRMSTPAYLTTPFEAWEGVPVGQLWLDGWCDDGQFLAQRPELTRLHTLALNEWVPGFDGLPHLAGLRHLRLHHGYDNSMPDEVISLRLPSLESLSLEGNVRHWQRLVGSCRRPLRRLRLQTDDDPFSRDDEEWRLVNARWLAETQHVARLEHLSIHQRANTTWAGHVDCRATFQAVGQMITSGRLRHLSVSPYNVDELVACPSWGGLESLDIGQVPNDGPVYVQSLANTPHGRQIRSLRFGYWEFDEPETPGATLGPAFAGLRHLSIGIPMRDDLSPILTGPYRANLLRLSIDRIPDGSLACLAATPLSELRHLAIGGYGHPPDLSFLCGSPNLPNLCTLVFLGSWRIPREVAERLARASGFPHLSLIGSRCRTELDADWFVLENGEAKPVRPDVLSLDSNWWEHDLDEDRR